MKIGTSSSAGVWHGSVHGVGECGCLAQGTVVCQVQEQVYTRTQVEVRERKCCRFAERYCS